MGIWNGRSAEERFMDKVFPDPNTGCWLWGSANKASGRGLFTLDGGSRSAPRVAFMLFVGPIPTGQCVLHTCDVPECVNPGHLYLGTQQDNVRDRDRRGRAADVRGEKNPNASRMTDQKVREIRALRGTMKQKEIALLYGISVPRVSGIQLRRDWGHVP